MDKKEISAILDEMGTLLELKGENPFKSRAFHNASRAVDGITTDLATLVESGKLIEVNGIGKSIAEVITELVKKGKSGDYEELRRGFPDGVLEMLRIQGMGPKKVKVLFEKLHLKSIEELEAAANAGKLSSLDGFGVKTQENILKGIEDLKKRSDKNLYPKARAAADRVFSDLKSHKEVIRAAVAGSLRRHKEVIGDIDILISARDAHRLTLMKAFSSHPEVDKIVAEGETKSSVVLKGGISCDLRIVADVEFPFALNYFTGSKEHNVAMRSRAKKYGWSLNEYGFSDIGAGEKRGRAKQAVKCAEESDIYKALDLVYVPPELRENMGEIEIAGKNKLPRLIESKDICGTFHCHSTYSDGVNTLEQMAQGAQDLGWQYLGIADHSKAAAYAGGLTAEKVKAQFVEIDALNKRMNGFRIFKGTECDILPNGELDWPEKLLASFEYVVVAIHSSFKMTERQMTNRIIKALRNKHVTMLAHPTGRLLLSRDAYPVDMIKVMDAAADYGKIIEINAHPMRLDLDWRLCKYAKEKGITIAINPDAHNIEGLRDVEYGVGIARKGWLEKQNILNAQHLDGVLEYLQLTS